METATLVQRLKERIQLIIDFQEMASEYQTPMPHTFIGGNARIEELRRLIALVEDEK